MPMARPTQHPCNQDIRVAQPGNDRDVELQSPPTEGAVRVDRIGASLRRAFDDVAAEALPDAFEDLLRRLE
jgi:hypothetical protein